MTRLWPDGLPIRVTSDAAGTPQTLIWQGRAHPVEGIANRWRIDEGWWYRRIWRDYFKLYTRTGLLVVVYRDLLADRWYLQRLYD